MLRAMSMTNTPPILRSFSPRSLSPRARVPLAVALAAATLAAGGRARAGVTVVMQRGTDPATTMYLEGDHARIENVNRGPQGTTVIIDAAAKTIEMVNDANKTYSEVTEEDMKRMRARVDSMKPQLEAAMKNMPPEQRKLIEDKLASLNAGSTPVKPRDYKFEKLGQKKSINGISCETYRVLEDGKPHEEDCISPWSAGLVQKSDLEGLRKFGEEMAKDFTGSANGGQHDIFAHMDKYPGIPVSRVPLEDDGSRGPEEQIKSVKRGSIAGAKFVVPAGYTKKELPMGGMGGPPGRSLGGPPHP
jgi:hypothetical protein